MFRIVCIQTAQVDERSHKLWDDLFVHTSFILFARHETVFYQTPGSDRARSWTAEGIWFRINPPTQLPLKAGS